MGDSVGAARPACAPALPTVALLLALVGVGGSPGPVDNGCFGATRCGGQDVARTGAVTGVVSIPPAAPPAGPPRLSPYSRRRYGAPAPSVAAFDPRDVVVFVATAPADGAPSHARVSVTQEELTIVPHVTTVAVGTEIVFPNDDDVFHNLFSLSDTKRFNLGRYPPGESRSVTFDRPGLVRVFCDIHSDMAAVILVLDHGRFTRPAADGSYRIDGVPPGPQTVVAWHETLAPDSAVVMVPEGAEVRADLGLGR